MPAIDMLLCNSFITQRCLSFVFWPRKPEVSAGGFYITTPFKLMHEGKL